MANTKIVRPGDHPGISKIGDYVFVDGAIIAPKAVGDKYANILCRYYGCTQEDLPEESAPVVDGSNPSLETSNTRDGVADEGEEDESEEEG